MAFNNSDQCFIRESIGDVNTQQRAFYRLRVEELGKNHQIHGRNSCVHSVEKVKELQWMIIYLMGPFCRCLQLNPPVRNIPRTRSLSFPSVTLSQWSLLVVQF